jgi:hypothetical protein
MPAAASDRHDGRAGIGSRAVAQFKAAVMKGERASLVDHDPAPWRTRWIRLKGARGVGRNAYRRSGEAARDTASRYIVPDGLRRLYGGLPRRGVGNRLHEA